MKVFEIKKEDNYYFQGPFWIISNSVKDILDGNFQIIGEKYLSDYNGNYIDDSTSKSQKTHKNLWNTKYKIKYDNVEYTYYPRGRVSIHNGLAYIHINSKCNIPKVIDKIINEYAIRGLDITIDLNDTYQGSHYDFELK